MPELSVKVKWQFQDIGLLQSHYRNLQAVNSTHAEAVKAKINNLQGWKWIFAVRTFLGKNNNLRSEHKNDPRFRNIYFLLVNLLPLKDAETLREELIQYAADTGDHTVSDRFVQLLRIRKAQT